jgi:hypothetical protein
MTLIERVRALIRVRRRRASRAGPLPPLLQGLRVLAYTPVDTRHRFAGGNERRWVDATGAEVLYRAVAGLAICEESDGEGVVLIGCDRRWRPVWRTYCTTVAVAEGQAEFEYEGTSRTWVRLAP